MAKAQYIGVSGVARKVKQPYIGVSGVARKVKNGYIGVSGVARQFFAGGTPMSDLATGSSVYLNENGSPVEYLVVHQGLPSSIYDSSCDGTWLLRKKIIYGMAWHTSVSNKLEGSNLQTWLNSTMFAKYDASVQNIVKEAKIPYRKGGGSTGTNQSGANGLSCKVFLLSGYEVGFTTSNLSSVPVDGAKLSYFESGTGTTANAKRVAELDEGITNTIYKRWWTRSPCTDGTSYIVLVFSDGSIANDGALGVRGVRPALILPYTALVDDSGLVIGT